ncbi:hypothetical protein SKAU_G00028040 [Synaphobranchus kaupii]|uniref:Uncharacterized protein n=1 Tax=Synaphobranchus kaupii TaxID=118154 RepID=A0A9Q1GEE4_SYNKA|nr:hypothetical protein SKAU_G00028040 [Synaphobranchus kaupii]
MAWGEKEADQCCHSGRTAHEFGNLGKDPRGENCTRYPRAVRALQDLPHTAWLLIKGVVLPPAPPPSPNLLPIPNSGTHHPKNTGTPIRLRNQPRR